LYKSKLMQIELRIITMIPTWSINVFIEDLIVLFIRDLWMLVITTGRNSLHQSNQGMYCIINDLHSVIILTRAHQV